jgi:hypothetical protein
METMLMTLADAARKPSAATWKSEIMRIFLTVAVSLSVLGVWSL